MNFSWKLESINDRSPITWWGNIPVFGATILVLVHCAAFAVVALAAPLGAGGLVGALAYSSAEVLGGLQIWRLATYALVSWPPSFWFLVEMAMLFYFGQEVEKALGRRSFFILYGILVLVPSFAFSVMGVFSSNIVLAGAGAAHFSVFLAFAIMYPGALMLLNIPARAFAVGFFVFNTVILISYQDWTRLAALWLDAGAAIFYLRAIGAASLGFTPPIFSFAPPERREEPRATEPAIRPKRQKPPPVNDPLGSIDPILEKISRHGLASLSAAERERLEKARAALLEKERASRE